MIFVVCWYINVKLQTTTILGMMVTCVPIIMFVLLALVLEMMLFVKLQESVLPLSTLLSCRRSSPIPMLHARFLMTCEYQWVQKECSFGEVEQGSHSRSDSGVGSLAGIHVEQGSHMKTVSVDDSYMVENSSLRVVNDDVDHVVYLCYWMNLFPIQS